MTRNEALQCNIDVAQRELDRRSAEGEDVSDFHVNQRTAAIERCFWPTTCVVTPHELQPGDVVQFYGGRFRITGLPVESCAHRPQGYWPQDSIGPSDCVSVESVCIEGEVEGYFSPGSTWRFQGNHRAAFSVEA